MSDNNFINDTLILDYFNGKLEGAVAREVREWIEANPSNRQYAYELKRIWTAAAFSGNEEDIISDSQLDKIWLRISSGSPEETVRKKIFTISSFYRIAAAVVITFGLSWLLISRINNSKETTYNEIITKAGEKSSIILADGTKVWLNGSTRFRYPTDLKSKLVEVYLNGEAFFDVSKVKNRLFVVRTSDLKIKVLGTRFNVKSYNEDKVIETTLISGKIVLEKNSQHRDSAGVFEMKPHEKAIFIKSNSSLSLQEKIVNNRKVIRETEKIAMLEAKGFENTLLKTGSTVALETTWKDGTLQFYREPLYLLAVKLERWYGVSIRIEDEALCNSRFTGVFDRETIEQALKALSMSKPFKFSINKDTVIIKAK